MINSLQLNNLDVTKVKSLLPPEVYLVFGGIYFKDGKISQSSFLSLPRFLINSISSSILLLFHLCTLTNVDPSTAGTLCVHAAVFPVAKNALSAGENKTHMG